MMVRNSMIDELNKSEKGRELLEEWRAYTKTDLTEEDVSKLLTAFQKR